MTQPTDIRQTTHWSDYLQRIGWQTETIGTMHVFIKPLRFLGRSIIKIQHPTSSISFTKIDKLAQKYKAALVVIEPHNVDFNLKHYKKNGYIPTEIPYMHTATLVIDLQQSETDLLKSFSENARRNIKKGEKNDLTISTIVMKDEKTEDAFEHFYILFANLARLKHFYLAPRHEIFAKMSALRQNSIYVFAYEKTGKTPIAGIWFYHFDKTLYYLNTGGTKRGYELVTNYLLAFEGMKLGQKMGLEIFDFGGIYDPRFPSFRKSARNYTEFKKRFHGALVEYPQPMTKFYSFPFKLFYLWSSRVFK